MNCPRCKAAHPEGKNYCSDCGTPLNASLTYLEGFVRDQIKTSLDARFKDQKLVEFETSQAVVERVHGWSKLFAYFIAIPLAVLLVGFSIAGIKKYEDFTALVHGAEQEIKPRLEQAKASSESAMHQADEAQRKAEDARKTIESELKSASGVAEKVQTLSTKFSRLEQQTSLQMKDASEQADKQLADLNKKIDAAAKDIAEQQKKLASTNELVKSLFSKGRTEYFDTKTTNAKLVTFPLGKNTLVLILLAQAPISQTLDIKWHVFSQPKGAYGVIKGNVAFFNWGDPSENLKQHPLEVTYVPDATDTNPVFKALSVRDNVVYADDTVVMTLPPATNVPAPK